MEREPKPEKTQIEEMPDRETLERFLDGMSGSVRVYFDKDEGKFVDMDKPKEKK